MIDLEKLKNEELKACRIEFMMTKPFDVTVYETYYNEDKTKQHKQSTIFKTDLYGSVYQIKFQTYDGVFYKDGSVGVTYLDSDDEVNFYWDIDKLYLTEEEAIGKFIEKNINDYILYWNRGKFLYDVSTFHDCNTLENINKFMELMGKNDNIITIINYPIKKEVER